MQLFIIYLLFMRLISLGNYKSMVLSGTVQGKLQLGYKIFYNSGTFPNSFPPLLIP